MIDKSDLLPVLKIVAKSFIIAATKDFVGKEDSDIQNYSVVAVRFPFFSTVA